LEEDKILLAHGSGGRVMHGLIEDLIAPAFDITRLADAAVLEDFPSGRAAFTTDSYVVSPIFFPGGDIGELAVCGTVNDLAMMGAAPLYLSAGFILEEGLPLRDLKRIVFSMADAARKAGVRIMAGDTKVVERGKCDGLFINTAGVGALPAGLDLSPEQVRTGDRVIVSGPIGMHGMAIMAGRHGLSFDPPILSDTAPLNRLVADMLSATSGIRVMRDPTRGGLATTLKEIAEGAPCRILLKEEALPLVPGVRGGCELLGLDPLYVANEGILTAIVEASESERLVDCMRNHPLGQSAAVIGVVMPGEDGKVLLETRAGGTRMLEMLMGDQLPRIC